MRVRWFKPYEFECRCGCGMKAVSEYLVWWLDTLRRAWGDMVIVNSGRRCAAHNRTVGGAAQSRHLIGCAADITCIAGGDFNGFAHLASRMAGTGADGWEFIIHSQKNFIHVAVPRDEASRVWGP